MIISMIAAVTENNVIGQGGTMPWHLPEDLKYFKATTTGHTVIMGRKTWKSLGKYAPLPNRRNVVLTRDVGFQANGVDIFSDLQSALMTCKNDPSIHPALIPSSAAYRGTQGEVTQDEIFIIGGGQIYKEAMPLANRLYITRIHATIEGDTFFPDIPPDFKLVKSTPGQSQDPRLTFNVWERL